MPVYSYKENNNNLHEVVRMDTVYRLSVGFILKSNHRGVLPPLAPIRVNMENRTAIPCLRLRVLAEAEEKVVKVSKGLIPNKGDKLSNGTNTYNVSSVDTSHRDYNVITFTANVTGFKVGDILFEQGNVDNEPKSTANYLNYAPTKAEDGATITAIAKGFEVKEKRLVMPLLKADKETLGGMFIYI